MTCKFDVTFCDAIPMLLVGGRNRTVNEEQDMNTNTLDATDGSNFADTQASAVQNARSPAAPKLTLFLLWAAVSVPLVWGVMKAWQEVQPMF
jgi:hypothetical protein